MAMKSFRVTYKKGTKNEKTMEVRERDEESAILQSLTHWHLNDGKVVRKHLTIKPIKGII
jgi:hypothetical protein